MAVNVFIVLRTCCIFGANEWSLRVHRTVRRIIEVALYCHPKVPIALILVYRHPTNHRWKVLKIYNVQNSLKACVLEDTASFVKLLWPFCLSVAHCILQKPSSVNYLFYIEPMLHGTAQRILDLLACVLSDSSSSIQCCGLKMRLTVGGVPL